MRTTLTIDDDVLASARAMAEQRGVPVGSIVSELARKGLTPAKRVATRNGIRLFGVGEDKRPVTPELIKQLAEEVD